MTTEGKRDEYETKREALQSGYRAAEDRETKKKKGEGKGIGAATEGDGGR
jgi:hypothetical protein